RDRSGLRAKRGEGARAQRVFCDEPVKRPLGTCSEKDSGKAKGKRQEAKGKRKHVNARTFAFCLAAPRPAGTHFTDVSHHLPRRSRRQLDRLFLAGLLPIPTRPART